MLGAGLCTSHEDCSQHHAQLSAIVAYDFYLWNIFTLLFAVSFVVHFELELKVWILTSKNSAFFYKKIPGQVVICKAVQFSRLIYLETENYS